MKILSLNSPSPLTLGSRSHSSARRNSAEKSAFFSGQTLGTPTSSKRPADARNPVSIDYRIRAIGSVESSQTTEKSVKEEDLVFVAGATGRVGSRTVRELLKLEFRVRAGVRSAQRAETLVQSVQQMKLDGITGSKPVEKLEIVRCDLENPDEIKPAIGNASIVICCIGASEKEVFDITGPCRIDYRATKNLVDAATVAKVDHFILLTSLGTNKIGFPAAILNLFWGVLIWKRKAEETLIASGLPYTIVRPGGMERPTDAYKETHNMILADEDTLFGGQVSNLQVAELLACMAKNRRLSYCKVVEVIAETTAPLTPMEELLAKMPSKRELPPELQPDPIPAAKTNSRAKKEPIQVEASTTPLSPYTVYEDLKPPTSPTPTPSTTPRNQTGSASGSNSGNGAAGNGTVVNETADNQQQKSKPLSPFTMYEDLKPPSSPMPSMPKY